MGRIRDWLSNHGFQHEDPDRFGVTPGTMWESVILLILLANLILTLLTLFFSYLNF